MLSVRLIKKLEGIEKCSKNGHKARKLFQILTNNPELWMQAYAQIYPNKGALTKGAGETTIDGFCEDRVANLIKRKFSAAVHDFLEQSCTAAENLPFTRHESSGGIAEDAF